VKTLEEMLALRQPLVVIYHDLCMDGFTAAYVAQRRLGKDAILLPHAYGSVISGLPKGRCSIFMLDVSFARGLMDQVALDHDLVVLDHHKSAQAALEGAVPLSAKVRMNLSPEIIIGIDEVGRGCVFGPLAVCGIANPLGWTDARVRDSKEIKSEKRKNDICADACKNTIWSLAVAHNTAIDQYGITAALTQAMIRVLDDLVTRVGQAIQGTTTRLRIIGDGNDMYPIIARYECVVAGGGFVTVQFLPKADSTFFEVSAASIVAKASRDLWCHDIVKANPTLAVYGIDGNKGYASSEHTHALVQHGLTGWHRKTFCATLLATHAIKMAAARAASAA